MPPKTPRHGNEAVRPRDLSIEDDAGKADGPVCCPRSLSTPYLVRRTEVDALVDADVHDIVSRVRETLVCFRCVGRRAKYREGGSVSEEQLECTRHGAIQIVRPRGVLRIGRRGG